MKLSSFSLFESKVNDMCANLISPHFKIWPRAALSEVEFLSGYKLMPLYVPAMEAGGATHLWFQDFMPAAVSWNKRAINLHPFQPEGSKSHIYQ